jgi:uncharacterized protein YkwD
MKTFKSLLRTILVVFNVLQANALLAASEEHSDVSQLASAIARPVFEQRVFTVVNVYRAANLLPALTWSPVAAQLARNHSINMANGVVPFGHQDVEERFLILRSAIPSLTRFGENVAYNQGSPTPVATAINSWVTSPPHYANILGDYNMTGVGVASNAQGEVFFTQIFIKAGSQSILPFKENLQALSKDGSKEAVSNSPPSGWEVEENDNLDMLDTCVDD